MSNKSEKRSCGEAGERRPSGGKDSYHHGNLRSAIIEESIRIINEEGVDKLSFRKIAVACGVSHAAPYAHFANKEEIVEAIQEHVTGCFSDELVRIALQYENISAEKAIIEMGKGYVQYFRKHPEYFKFLFSNQLVSAHMDVAVDDATDFEAFRVMKRLYLKLNEQIRQQTGLEKSPDEQNREMMKLWSIVHGLAAIACMKNVVYPGDLERDLERLLT